MKFNKKFWKTTAFAIISLIIIFTFGFVISRTFLIIYTKHRNEIEVPDLTGKNFKKAKHDLYKSNLYIEKIGERNNNEILSGSIISQHLQPGSKAKKGFTIQVIVSKGPKLVQVPILDNLSVEEAKIRLQNVGLKSGNINYSYSNEISKGNIIYSQPVFGMEIPKLSKINLIVSLGKIPKISDERGIYDSFLEDLEE